MSYVVIETWDGLAEAVWGPWMPPQDGSQADDSRNDEVAERLAQSYADWLSGDARQVGHAALVYACKEPPDRFFDPETLPEAD